MTEKIDSIFRTRSLGVAARGIPDQYADGKAAKVWEKYIGDASKRTGYYKEKLLKVLHDHGVKTVLDVACGTGVDSIMLVENGFKVTSLDASDKMLKYALKTRWNRRRESSFDDWVIEEGNWLSLRASEAVFPEEGYDALICMGNSFAHLPDFDGEQKNHYLAIENFREALRPGGILVIDHRNYDHIIKGGKPPMKNIYYSSDAPIDVKTSVLIVDGNYRMVTLDYHIVQQDDGVNGSDEPSQKRKREDALDSASKFRLSYYPHLLESFNKLITGVFGKNAKHTVLGDFQPLNEVETPAYYIHIVERVD